MQGRQGNPLPSIFLLMARNLSNVCAKTRVKILRAEIGALYLCLPRRYALKIMTWVSFPAKILLYIMQNSLHVLRYTSTGVKFL